MGTYNKIIINDEVILDLSSDTITTNNLLEGVTAHDATGMQITGKIKKYNKEYTGNLEILEPVAYSYNGTVLPALPAWDKEKYPYAYMMKWGGVLFDLILCTRPLYYDREVLLAGAMEYDYLWCKRDCEALAYQYDKTNADHDPPAWYYQEEGSGAFAADTKVFSTSVLKTPLWANSDLYKYDDNTLYLSASDPVPVYE